MQLKRPNLITRLRAAFQPGLLLPAQKQSERMPDLERWTMPHRSVDMQDWTNARNLANNVLNPDRSRLLDLYDSILVDSHLASTMESRVLRVVRSRYRLVKNGEAQPDLLPLLETPWFEDFLRYVAEAAFRGHTLIELGELARPGELKAVNRIDPRNVLPWSGLVVRRQGEVTGYEYRKPPLNAYLIEVGRPEDLGLLCDVGPVAIVKKYAVGSWSDYVHKYGIPPRWVKTNSRDARRFKQLETMMQNMLSSAYGVIEGDEEIQIMQTPGTDAHKVFDELIARMNSEISKRLLGQDGTTDNKDASGTYGSLKVLQGVAEDRHAADKASVGYVINQELLPRLTALGYPFAGVRFEWDGLRDLGPMELVDAVSKLGMVFDIDPEYVEERTGIRILGARRMPGEIGGNWPGWPGGGGGNPPGNGRQGGGKPGTGGTGTGEEDDDEDGDGVTARAFLPETTDCGCPRHGLITAQAPRINEAVIDELLRAAMDGKDWSNSYMVALGQVYQEGLLRTWKHDMDRLDYSAPDHAAAAAMEINVFMFSASKATAALLDLNKLAREGGTFQQFRQRVDDSGLLDQYNRHTLETEWQMAVNTGTQSSRYFRQVENKDSLPFWQYSTMEDGAVRPAHAALDGKVFKADDAIWARIYPPNGWRCRCYVQPLAFEPEEVLDEQQGLALMKASDPKGYTAMEKGGFLRNRALEEVVFDLNLAHRNKLRQREKEERDKAKQQGLPVPPRGFVFGVEASYGRKGMDHETLKPDLPPRGSTLADNQAAIDWMRANAMATDSNGKPVLVMTDYNGRKVHLTEEQFIGHLGAPGTRRGERHQVANRIPDVLKNPDEVWIEQGVKTGRGSLNYVKMDQTGIIRVAVRTEDGKLHVATWTGELNDDQRQGLLIKPMPRP